MNKIQNFFTRVLAIRPGDEEKTILLYVLHLVFYLGLSWGANSNIALFLGSWEAEYQGVMFIIDAFLLFFMGLAYTFLVNRLSNQRLLLGLLSTMIAWQILVWVLLHNSNFSGPHGLAYPFYYLTFDAFRDLSVLSILNYINDFYDTRSAKQALPLMLSASLVGAILAGVSGNFVKNIIGLENVSFAWIVCLVSAIGMMYVIRLRLPKDIAAIKKTHTTSTQSNVKMGKLEELRAGFNVLRDSSILRWMALAAMLVTMLMNLMFYQSNRIIRDYFYGNQNSIFQFTNVVSTIANSVALPMQLAVVGRLVSSFGVGNISLVFPITTVVIITVLNLFPTLPAAIGADWNRGIIRKSIQNPLEAMLYNSVPIEVKARARGFISGLVVPFGMLGAGLMMQLVTQGWISAISPVFIGLSIALALVYLIVALRVRAEYSRSLAKLLSNDDMSIFRNMQTDFEPANPATLAFLNKRIDESQEESQTIFLAEILYELQGVDAFPHLEELANTRGPVVYANLLQMIGADWSTHEMVRRMCLQGIQNENPAVRQASLQVLVSARDATSNPAVLDTFKNLLQDVDESIQASVIPILIASRKEDFAAPGRQKLVEWLASQSNKRTLALQVLAKTGNPSLLGYLQDDLHSPQIGTRLDAVKLISELLSESVADVNTRKLALETLGKLINDPQESVQLEVINAFGQTETLEAGRVILPALHSESFPVRKTACNLIQSIPENELEAGLNSTSIYFAESAAYLLTKRGSMVAKRRVMEMMDMLIFDIHQIYAHRLALADKINFGGVSLLNDSLSEQAHMRLDRFFWLISALCNWEDAQNIRKAMSSSNRTTHANAVEALESLSSPRLARLVAPLLDSDELVNAVKIGREVLNIPTPTLKQIFLLAWPQLTPDTTQPIAYSSSLLTIYADEWIKSVAIYALVEMCLSGQNDPWPGDTETRLALQKTVETGTALSSEEARLALARLDMRNNLRP
jgi:hypothetical protein